MSRLRHSSGGFFRSLQMSSARFFAFVEGGLDRSFVDRLLENVCSVDKIRHQVIAVKEIPGSAGGKATLIALFRQYRTQGKLSINAFGKKMVCAFFADKDSDDYSRKQLRSPHLFYTRTYDLEAHLFSCGDLQRALADACGLTLQQAKTLIPDQRTWLTDIAEKWKAWTALCMISHANSVNCGCTYDRHSAINADPLAYPDPIELDLFKGKLATSLSLSRADFDCLYDRAERHLDKFLTSGSPMRYFKGKWLMYVLQKHLESANRPADSLVNSAGEKVTAALVAQVGGHTGCQCCSPFALGIRALAEELSK